MTDRMQTGCCTPSRCRAMFAIAKCGRLTGALLGLGLLIWIAPALSQTQAIVPRGENFFVTGPPVQSGGRPGIATDGSNFMTTWRIGNLSSIACARISRDGVLLDTNPIIVGPGLSVPSIAFDGSNFMLVWTNAGEIKAARVSPAGVLVDATPLAITVDGRAKERPINVAFDGSNYLVVWRTDIDEIRGARVTKAGATLDGPTGFLIGNGFYPWTVAGGGNFVVAWHANGPSGFDVYAARVAPDGTVVDPGGFLVADVPGDMDHVSIAYSGVNFLITWHDSRNADNRNNGQAYGIRLAADGRTILDAAPFQIADMTLWQVPVTVVFDGTDFFVAWHADIFNKFRLSDVFGRRVSIAGTLLDEKPIPIITAYAHQFSPSLAADGDRLLMTVPDSRNGSVCYGNCLQAQLLERKTVAAVTTLAGSPPTGPPVWSVEASPTGSEMNAVFAVSGGGIYAAAGGDASPILQRIGGVWQTVHTSVKRVYALWVGTAPTQVHGVGLCWYGEFFNGAQWVNTGCRGLGPPNDPFVFGFGIWGFANGSYVTVGSEGRFRFDGALPMNGSTGTSVTLYGVWGSSPTNIYAVGELGHIMHFNGANWTRVANVPTVQTLNAIWGSAPDNIFVAGDFGTILHFDGAAWTVQATPTTAHLLGISGAGTNRAYAVGSRGAIIRYDGSQWNAEASGTTSWLYGVASADNMVWAVGDAGLILKRDLPGGNAISVSLVSSLNPAAAGAAITLTASVTGAAGAATGSVAFKDGAFTIAGCEAVAVSAGSAVCNSSVLAAGSRSLTAAYSGSTVYEDRVSAALIQVVRGVPSAPLIGAAIAGDGEAAIAFTGPANDGGSAVTLFTATCNPGAVNVSSNTSPIIVAPLANNVLHSCSVTATNATGTSAPSATVDVTPSPAAPVTLIRAVSRKTHSTAGPFDLRIDIAATASGPVTIEPRNATAGHLLILRFNVPITDSLIAAQTAPSGNVTAVASGKDVLVTLTGVSELQRTTVTLNNLNGSGGNVPVSLGFALGDVNQSRAINAADISAVKARNGQVLSAANFLADLNTSGAIDDRDVSLVKARAGRMLP